MLASKAARKCAPSERCSIFKRERSSSSSSDDAPSKRMALSEKPSGKQALDLSLQWLSPDGVELYLLLPLIDGSTLVFTFTALPNLV